MIDYTYNDSSGAPSLVEPGEHFVKATGYETGITDQGNHKITLSLQIKDGPRTYDVLTFTPKAMWKMDLVLKAFSISKKEPLPPRGTKLQVDEAFMNRYIIEGYAKAQIIVDEWQGKKRNKVGTFIVPDELPPPAVDFEAEDLELKSEDESEDVPF